MHYQHEWMSNPSGAKPLLPASSFDFLRWLLLSFWDAKKKKYSLQVDMQYAFDALVAVTAGTQGWPATAAGVERIASKAGIVVTARRNRYKTRSVEKLVSFFRATNSLLRLKMLPMPQRRNGTSERSDLKRRGALPKQLL